MYVFCSREECVSQNVLNITKDNVGMRGKRSDVTGTGLEAVII